MDSVSGSSQIREIALQACLGEGNSLFQEPAEGRGQSVFSKGIYWKQFLSWPRPRSQRSRRGTLPPPPHLRDSSHFCAITPSSLITICKPIIYYWVHPCCQIPCPTVSGKRESPGHLLTDATQCPGEDMEEH